MEAAIDKQPRPGAPKKFSEHQKAKITAISTGGPKSLDIASNRR